MAEALAALGVAASVIAVIQISEQVVSACYQYYKTTKDAKKEIIDVINVVSGLKSTLENLRHLLDDNDQDSRLSHHKSLVGALKACEEALKQLASKLGIKIEGDLNTDNIKVNFKKKMMWPWKEKEVGKILAVIEKHKSTFILALTGDTLRLSVAIHDSVMDMKDNVTQIAGSIQTIQVTIDDKTKDILTWLTSNDPSTNHNSARHKHEPTTGTWFVQSKAFLKWTKDTNASLWLTGIPGAGKTVLCSTVIEHTKEICHSTSARQYAYFYFDFNDPQKQTVVGMLRSFILQLCADKAPLPSEVSELYKQCNDGRQQPTPEGLLKVLLCLFTDSVRTYLVMDALDECSEREKLVDYIGQIVHKSSGVVNLLVTSRKEWDIVVGLKGVIDVQMSLERENIDADIDLHVRKSLETDRHLRKWPLAIKQEILAALVQGANGM